jgi:ubiquinone/menaquinone biosynthesis C-methylase UbiE
MTAPQLTEKERLTAVVYGDTFALYDDVSFDEFLEPLYVRLRANGIGTEVFAGKRCLDAGCGGGRGSVLMAENGAAEVIGVDLSERNVETARRRADDRGLQQCTFVQGSLHDLTFPDESFDIVWCNGVLHHAGEPDAGLAEITRVLRTDGHLWLYLYGSGGVYWFIVDWIRALLDHVDVEVAVAQLQLMDVPVRRIAEWVDDWFVPHLRRYTRSDVEQRLSELGYENTLALDYGTSYDTSQRRVREGTVERELMGEGDLRFWATKTAAPRGSNYRLPDPPDGKGSHYADPPSVTRFHGALTEIDQSFAQPAKGSDAERLIVAASIHAHTRGLLEQADLFEADSLESHLARVAALVSAL